MNMEKALVLNVKYRGETMLFAVQDGRYSCEQLTDIVREAVYCGVAELRATAARSEFNGQDDNALRSLGCVLDKSDGDVWRLTTPTQTHFRSTSAALRAITSLAKTGYTPAQRALELLADSVYAAVYDAVGRHLAQHGIAPIEIDGACLIDIGSSDTGFAKQIAERVRLLVCEDEDEGVGPEPDWGVYKQADYAACPRCGDDGIMTRDTTYGEGEVRVHKHCAKCLFSWDDIFDITLSVSDEGHESDNYGGM